MSDTMGTPTWRNRIDDGIVAVLLWGLPTVAGASMLLDLVRPELVVGPSRNPLVFALLFVSFAFVMETLFGRRFPRMSLLGGMRRARDPGASLKEKLIAPDEQGPAWRTMQVQIVALSVLALLVVTFR